MTKRGAVWLSTFRLFNMTRFSEAFEWSGTHLSCYLLPCWHSDHNGHFDYEPLHLILVITCNLSALWSNQCYFHHGDGEMIIPVMWPHGDSWLVWEKGAVHAAAEWQRSEISALWWSPGQRVRLRIGSVNIWSTIILVLTASEDDRS